MIQLSCKTRPSSADNHYRCKKASCSTKIPSIVHSSSAPAKLDEIVSPQTNTKRTENSEQVSETQGNISDSSCSTNRSGLYKRNLSTGSQSLKQSDVSGDKIVQQNLEGDVLSERTENNDETECSLSLVNKTSESFEKSSESPETLLDNDNEQESSSKSCEDSNQHEFDKTPCTENDITGKQGAVSSDINASLDPDRRDNFDQIVENETSEQPDESEKNPEKSLMSRLIEGGKKLSSANNSPKATRKQENSDKTSNELPKDSETSSGLTANLRRNFKNRFADISISFRKNEDSVNASEVRWQSEDSEDTQEPPRTDGKRNILAAAQERGRAFIPELKNKFSGLSNRSPRMERKRDWEKVIQESGCRTTIIQI